MPIDSLTFCLKAQSLIIKTRLSVLNVVSRPGMTQHAPCSMWAFLRLKDTVVKSILDEAATLEHPQQRVRDNLLLPFSTLATWAIFGVSVPCMDSIPCLSIFGCLLKGQ